MMRVKLGLFIFLFIGSLNQLSAFTPFYSVSQVKKTLVSHPKVGDTAKDFSLKTLKGQKVSLKNLTKSGKTVILVLRGWPNYQCPLCTRQIGEFIKEAESFAQKKAKILMIYPGPAKKLNQYAKEFIESKKLPKNFLFVTDPDYTFTNLYGLRWDAKNETAYPSTFVLDQKRKIHFAKISNNHGGRSSAKEVLKSLDSF